ncbi:dihydroorotate dehydrogenase electron transfer subunit [Vampirovibrio sp.]|uniref:dihydroorotate dehydrogenase electron transfer subunit n=1 Tax=Vampirovibrio sp. TaxID=2717857 RepID=UPI003593555C
MSLAHTPIQDMRCQVIFNRECGNGLKVLRLQTLDTPFACLPGQFVMLDLPQSKFYFRRPFSVIDTPTPDTLDIYYKRVGTGTSLMWDFQPGNTLKCLGPLGNGFSTPRQPESALYIGGGIGIAPPYLMAKRQSHAGHCFYGVRSAGEVGLSDELNILFGENLNIATDDGSHGFHGNVCQLLEQRKPMILSAQEAYVCGPTRMMEAVAELLKAINPALRIEVSLEERMPCGTGACTGCVTPRTDRYLPSKVCIEGPVFEAGLIRWQGDLLPLSAFCEDSPCPL